MRLTKLTTVIAASMFIMVVGTILNLGQLYWMAGILLSLPGVGWLYSLLQSRGIAVRRRLPATGRVGEWITVELEARNSTLLPKLHLWLLDSVPPSTLPEANSQLPLHLPPHGSDRGSYSLRLERRGCHQLGPAHILSVDPLGLSAVSVGAPGTSEILVYPRIVPLRPDCLRLCGESGVAQTDQTRRHGEGASFYGIREYRPGDPLRRVHWRSSARLGHLAVVEFEDERASELVVAVETLKGTSVGDEIDSTFECAATVAASLAAAAAAQGHLIRLVAPGWSAWAPTAGRGPEALPSILETLARAEPNADRSLADEYPDIVTHARGGSTVVWITPVAGESTVEAARALIAARMDVVVLGLDAASWGERRRDPAEWSATADQLGRLRAGFALFHKGEPIQRVIESIR
jgi:uncharacterized protein (DUF58 family)